MAAIAVFKRYEKKYLMDESVMARVIAGIKDHMQVDEYCTDGRTYHICNLYFDTENSDVIRESLSKPFYKEKLRLRSYGIPAGPGDKVFLEMKKKINGLVTKRRARLKYGEAKDFLATGRLPEKPSYMQGQVLGEISYYLSHKEVNPVMQISYDRTAFFDKNDRNFRLTFDENLRYIKTQGEYYSQDEGSLLIAPELRLMEVKVSESMPLWFCRLMSNLGISRSSFSKYGVAYKTCLKEEYFNNNQNINVLGRL